MEAVTEKQNEVGPQDECIIVVIFGDEGQQEKKNYSPEHVFLVAEKNNRNAQPDKYPGSPWSDTSLPEILKIGHKLRKISDLAGMMIELLSVVSDVDIVQENSDIGNHRETSNESHDVRPRLFDIEGIYAHQSNNKQDVVGCARTPMCGQNDHGDT